jgi:hypothetical protein
MDDDTTKERKSEFIGIRIEPSMKKFLIDEAKERGETLSAWCYWLMGIGRLALYDEEFLKANGLEG